MKNNEKSPAFWKAHGSLKKDQSEWSEGCETLVLRDLKERLSDYFFVSQTPSMSMEKRGDSYLVQILFVADGVKKFHVLK